MIVPIPPSDTETIAALTARVAELVEGLEDVTGAGEEAWGSGRPCVKRARALLTPAQEKSDV